MILVGQPELADRLNAPELRQLKQRIALRCTLTPLGLRETAAYIAGRIRIAGGDAARVFTREAVALIHERSHGIPRLISVLCDNALVNGFASGLRPVDRQSVLDVCRDFDFSYTAPAGSPAAPPRAATAAGGTIDPGRPGQSSPGDRCVGGDPATANASGGRFSLFGSLLSGNR